jgi:homoserine kinase type II
MVKTRVGELVEILNQYSLGEAAGCDLNVLGYVNTSYTLHTTCPDGVQKTYFLRKYKPGIKEAELIFEHSLICHLVEKKVCPVAHVHTTRTGQTYLPLYAEGGDSEPRYYAIFDYLPGEDRYTWINPHCTPAEICNSAAVLAQFHRALIDFKPQGERSEAKIMDLLPQIYQFLQDISKRSRGTIFDAYLQENLDLILDNIRFTTGKLAEPGCQAMPQMPIHCDYHPGNLKFKGNQVTALFDFDWSKVDYRCFDVGLALFYFFTSWEENDGQLRVNDALLFLEAYQEVLLDGQNSCLLDKDELKYLPYMISAANLYVLNWTLNDFYHRLVKPKEYLIYLTHSIEFIRWFSKSGNLQMLQDKLNMLLSASIN